MSAKMQVAPSRNGHRMPPAKFIKPATDEQTRKLDLASIVPSPFNHRKHFDPDKLGRLADSIKKVGLLQAIIVRPHPKPKGLVAYELVAGERRFRAAKKAGLSKIQSVVRNLTDLQVIELQVIENDQREDVTPLERAAGYQALIDHGVTVEQVADKIDKSTQTVRRVLRLLRLPKILAEAMELGQVPVSTCELIVRIPNPELRDLAAQCVIKRVNNPRYVKNYKGSKNGEPLSKRETEELIAEHFVVQLKDAPFDLADAQLVAKAGSCKDCPKRAGNDPDPHRGVQPDCCTDPICYRGKLKAQQERTEADARRRGLQVLDPNQLGKVFQTWGGLTPGYIDVDAGCGYGKGDKTYRQLFGRTLDEKKLVLAHDEHFRPHWILSKQIAHKYLTDLGLIEDRPNEDIAAHQKEQKAARLRMDIRTGAVYKLGREIATQVEKDKVIKLLDQPDTKSAEWHRNLLFQLANQAIDSVQDFMADLLALCRGRLELPPRGPSFDESMIRDRLDKWLNKASASELMGIFVEAFLLNAGSNAAEDVLRTDDFASLTDQSWDEMIDEAKATLESRAKKKQPK